jgi:hypothetical protein
MVGVKWTQTMNIDERLCPLRTVLPGSTLISLCPSRIRAHSQVTALMFLHIAFNPRTLQLSSANAERLP